MKLYLAAAFAILVAASAQAQTVPARYVPLSNCALMDTRPFATTPIAPLGRLTANSTTFINVRGLCNVPTKANAVALNVVALNPSGAGRARILESTLPNATANAVLYWNAGSTATSGDPIVRMSFPLLEDPTDIQIWVSEETDMLIRVAGYFLVE